MTKSGRHNCEANKQIGLLEWIYEIQTRNCKGEIDRNDFEAIVSKAIDLTTALHGLID